MTWETMIAFNLVLLASLASPGPAMLYAIKVTMSSGRLAGFLSGLGLGTMAALCTLAAFLGLEAVFEVFPWAYTALRIGCALYLMWIAIHTWRNAHAPVGQMPIVHARSFVAGLLVNVGNPKSVLFAASVILVIFPKDMSNIEIGLVVLNNWLLEVTFYTILATVLSGTTARRGYLALKPYFDRIAATLLGAFGLRLILEK